MKTCIYFLVIISLLACENEIGKQEVLEVGETSLSIDKDVLAQSIAQALASNMSNGALKAFLKEEAMKQKDGDNDILFVEAINMDVNTRTIGKVGKISFRELLKKGFEKTAKTRTANSLNFEQTLKSIEKDYPLLQISIPDTECGTLEQVNFDNNPPLVAFLPENFDEKSPVNITAYDENGNAYSLNTAIEPTVPVVVISENERLIAVPLKQFPATRVLPYYQTELTAYYLRCNEGDYYVDGGGGYDSSTPVSKNRDSNDLMDYITKAKFRNQDALRRYESWVSGRPEVRVDIIMSNLPVKAIRYNSKGWWKGATRTLDSQVINWNQNELGKYITYYWSEEDAGSSSDVTVDTKVALANGVTTTVSRTIKAGSHNDEIGTTHVSYDDRIPSGGQEYDPSGSRDFVFWINLQ